MSGQILIAFLLQLQIPRKFLELIAAAVDMIPEIINAAGVQILVFLAGLQSIDPSLRGIRGRRRHFVGELLDDHFPASNAIDHNKHSVYDRRLLHFAKQRSDHDDSRNHVLWQRVWNKLGDDVDILRVDSSCARYSNGPLVSHSALQRVAVDQDGVSCLEG